MTLVETLQSEKNVFATNRKTLKNSQLRISERLTQEWDLLIGLDEFQVQLEVELDGVMQEQQNQHTSRGSLHSEVLAVLSRSISAPGMQVHISGTLPVVLADTFFRGWRRSLDLSLVLILSSVNCPALSDSESLVRGLLI